MSRKKIQKFYNFSRYIGSVILTTFGGSWPNVRSPAYARIFMLYVYYPL